MALQRRLKRNCEHSGVMMCKHVYNEIGCTMRDIIFEEIGKSMTILMNASYRGAMVCIDCRGSSDDIRAWIEYHMFRLVIRDARRNDDVTAIVKDVGRFLQSSDVSESAAVTGSDVLFIWHAHMFSSNTWFLLQQLVETSNQILALVVPDSQSVDALQLQEVQRISMIQFEMDISLVLQKLTNYLLTTNLYFARLPSAIHSVFENRNSAVLFSKSIELQLATHLQQFIQNEQAQPFLLLTRSASMQMVDITGEIVSMLTETPLHRSSSRNICLDLSASAALYEDNTVYTMCPEIINMSKQLCAEKLKHINLTDEKDTFALQNLQEFQECTDDAEALRLIADTALFLYQTIDIECTIK